MGPEHAPNGVGRGGAVPRRRFVDHGRRTVGAAVVLGLAGTVLVSVLPWFKFAYRSPSAHVAIETAAFLVPALAALLFAGRVQRSRSRTDLLLAASLVLVAATNLFFSILPALIEEDPGRFSTWAPVAGRLLGAAVFAAAALLPRRSVARPRQATLRMLLGAGVAIAMIAVFAALVADDLPRGLDPDLSPESASRPRIVGHPVVLGVQLVILALYAAATVGFLRRAERERDSLLLWVALAASLLALARFNYFLFPSLYSEWVYVGDFLRLASYLALLVGLGRELLGYQRGAADAAVFEERRRVARELHDGLAQELAYIRSEGRRISTAGGAGPAVARISAAAERALDEARSAISTLASPLDEPLDVTLTRAAEAVAIRMGARVEASSSAAPTDAPTVVRQALERIVREATTNAVRHGEAKAIRLEIEGAGTLRVAVVDDGSGFDPGSAPRPDSFGLISMRERAEAIGGELAIDSRPGDGTRVEVVIR